MVQPLEDPAQAQVSADLLQGDQVFLVADHQAVPIQADQVSVLEAQVCPVQDSAPVVWVVLPEAQAFLVLECLLEEPALCRAQVQVRQVGVRGDSAQAVEDLVCPMDQVVAN